MSTPTAPSASTTASTAALRDASSTTSSASVLQPSASRAASVSGLRAVAYTDQPALARRDAVAAPMPDEQPVISTARDGSLMPRLHPEYARRAGYRSPGPAPPGARRRPPPAPGSPDGARAGRLLGSRPAGAGRARAAAPPPRRLSAARCRRPSSRTPPPAPGRA